ncbi:MAG: cadherin-like beta sandwich domain-containing protein [Nitrosopumilus sp.]|nr:cadherin-like beta sandwich domain-containing protein [Nitrosopumilus sp.]
MAITVIANLPAPDISINPSTVDVTVGTAINVTIITAPTGGAVDSYSIDPETNNSLSFNTATGTISGTPTDVADVRNYTITATNNTGTATATVAITVTAVNNPPVIGTLDPITLNNTQRVHFNEGIVNGIDLRAITTDENQQALQFRILNAVEAYGNYRISIGHLDSGTGVFALRGDNTIHIHPQNSVTGTVNVVLQARDEAGQLSATKTLTVTITAPLALPIITATPSAQSVAAGTDITDVTITSSTGGLVDSYAISPTIENGLNFDTSTGTISGTPTTVAALKTYTITATNNTGTATATVAITVTQALSSNASLSNLTLSSVNLSFSTATPTYTVNVANSVESLTVTPNSADNNATITVDGTPIISGAESAPIDLVVAVNKIINIKVIAEDGNTSRTYTITVNRENDPSLSNIILSEGTLNPAFSSGAPTTTRPNTIDYTATVANTVISLTVRPTSTDGNVGINGSARIRLNTDASTSAFNKDITSGTTITSGAISDPIILNVGDNLIELKGIDVRSRTTRGYTITVTRAAAVPSITTVPSLSIVAGTEITPVIIIASSTGGAVVSYAINPEIPTGLSFNTSTATISGTPAAAATLETYTITATNTAGTATATVAITVTRALSSDASLSGITLSGGNTLGETFASTTLAYTASVISTVANLTITPISDNTATFTVNGVSAATSVSLAEGVNTITIVVTSEDTSTTQSYTILVTRAPSADKFVTVWNVPAGDFSFPGNGTYDINWGDGSATENVTVTIPTRATSHPYASAGTYTITVSNGIRVFELFHTSSSRPKLRDVVQWGDAPWDSLGSGFQSATNMTMSASDAPNLSGAPDLRNMFFSATSFNTNISDWNVGLITDMLNMFNGASAFNQNISGWDVSKVTNMTDMFTGATAFNANQNLGPWYIVPSANANGTDFTLAAQNGVLDAQSPNYELVEGAVNNNLFTLSNAILTPKDSTIADSNYNVLVVATGSSLFGSTNTHSFSININNRSNARLSALVLSQGITLDPVFTSATFTYSASVDNTISTLMVTPTLADSDATRITVNGAGVTNGQASTAISLIAGQVTTITVLVTAEDTTTTQVYTIDVTRAVDAPSINTSVPMLEPVVGVPITPVTITSTGGTVVSYSISPAIDNGLSFDTNTGVISGTPTAVAALKTYTITATNVTGNDTATVKIIVTSDLAVPIITASPSTLTAVTGTAIAPINIVSTGGAVANYAISPNLPNGLSLNATSGVISGTPTATVAAAIYTITATNTAGTATATVNITVRAPETDATLSGVTLSTGDPLNLTFVSSTSAYTDTVANNVASLTVTPTTTDSNASVTVNGADITSTGASAAINLTVGANNIITLIGTAEDGTTTRAYTITITRSAPPTSNNADLNSLTLSTGDNLSPTFNSATTAYSATVANTVSSLTVTPTTANGNATVLVNGFTATSTAASGTINLNVGANTITVRVTAQNGTTTKEYTITVTRAVSTAVAIPAITASVSTVNAVAGTPIPPVTITSSGGAVANYAITPTLNNGLSFNSSNLTISGTPDAAATVRNYTITASNATGTATATVAITVTAALTAPTITISTSSLQAVAGTLIAPAVTINSTGGLVANYGINPGISNGLSFNSGNGTISGTPTAEAALITYTITATNTAGTATVTVAITVTAVPVINASVSTVNAVAGTAITPVTITSSGGTVTSYTISPTIENGLSFSTTSGAISGAPTAATSATYTITATNAAGTATATVDIAVVNAYTTGHSNPVSATHTNVGGLTVFTLGQDSGGADIQATDGTITLPSGLSNATITVAEATSNVPTGDNIRPTDAVELEASETSARYSLVDIIVTNVSDSNPVTICLPFKDSTGTNINNPGLYHAATSVTPPVWNLLPAQQRKGNLVCGDTTGFSPFAVFEKSAAAETQILNAVLPQLLRATTKIAVDNINARIDQVLDASASDSTEASFNVGGSSSLQQFFDNSIRNAALKNKPSLKQLFNNASFLVPLNVAGGNNQGAKDVTLWGSGDYLNLADDVSGVDWEGEVISGSVGIDARFNKDLVAGASFSYSKGDVDYTNAGTNGTLINTLTSVHPYVGYDLEGGRVWGALGYGQGEVEINEQGKRDTTLRSLAFGGNRQLSINDDWIKGPGTTTLRLKGEVSLSNIKVDKNTNDEAVSIDANRYRIALEGNHKQTLANGASINPSVELGIRYDDDNGNTDSASGSGLELAVGYNYNDPRGLDVELEVYGLLTHESNYKEWGVSGLVKYQTNRDGKGLWLSLKPTFGNTRDNVADRVWQPTSVADQVNGESSNSLQFNTEIGYGLTGFFDRGLLTPYAGLSIANGKQSYSIGSRWAIDSSMNLSLVGKRKETEDSIELRGDFKF